MTPLTPEQQKFLESALGFLWAKKGKRGYRNRYCASKGSEFVAVGDSLVALGLAVRGREDSGSVMFHVTRAGCEHLKLSATETKRALE